MTIGTAFGILGISPTNDIEAIQHAFALRSRYAHPEENPEGFMELSKAYQVCIAYAKNKYIPGTDQVKISDMADMEDFLDYIKKQRENSGKEEAVDDRDSDLEQSGYYDIFHDLFRKQEEIKQVEQQLDELLDQLEKEKVIKDLSGYELALEYLSKLTPFASYDPMPHRVYITFYYSMKKKKRFLFYRKKMLRLLSGYSEVLKQADEIIMAQGYEENFAGFRTELTSFVFPALLWYFLAFVWIVRFFLTPLFAIMQPVVLQVPDGAVHYVNYSDELPEGSYVKTTLTEAHWVGIGYNEKTSTIKSGTLKMTIHTYFQYLFLQAMTTDGESVLIPLTATFSTQAVSVPEKVQDFFSSCTELAKEINQSGNYPMLGRIQCLDYSDPLQPGIPLYMDIVPFTRLHMDEELQKLLPDKPGIPFVSKQDREESSEQDTEESQEQRTVSASDNQLFTPETKGLFTLEDPPEEGTPLYREEKLYFFRHPILFLRHTGHPEMIIFHTFCGLAMLALLIALKKGKIPHVAVK